MSELTKILTGPLGFAITGLDLAKSAADQIGSIQDDVMVTVWGGPGSDRQRLYHLAAAIGFGLVKRLGPVSTEIPAPGMVAIQYDAADNHVTFQLRYSNTLAVVMATSLLPGRPAASDLARSLPVLWGPAEGVEGGKWNFTGPAVGNDLLAGFDTGLPVPDLMASGYANRTLLTKNDVSIPPDPNVEILGPGPTLNPRPHADARSRGSWVSLVYSALTTPGTTFDMTYPKPPASTNIDRYRGK